MNRAILIPRRKTVKISWLKRMTRLLANYRHYRKQGICHSIAWATARNTL